MWVERTIQMVNYRLISLALTAHWHRRLFQVRAKVHRHMRGVIHPPGYVDIPATPVVDVQEAIPFPSATSLCCQCQRHMRVTLRA